MKTAKFIAFKRLTGTDFYETSKPRIRGAKGGGQSYYDIAGSSVSLKSWETEFFHNISPIYEKQGPAWDIQLNSLGGGNTQTVRIASRTSPGGKVRNISIREQKIHSGKANRVFAWHPHHTAFPDLPAGITSGTDTKISPLIKDLVIYIISTDDGDYWAGWFQRATPDPTWVCDPQLQRMFSDSKGYIDLDPTVSFDEGNATWPFEAAAGSAAPPGPTTPGAKPTKGAGTSSTRRPRPRRKQHRKKTEAEITQELFDDDLADDSPELKALTRKVRTRNQRAVKLLKKLYKNCQITGDKFIFKKPNGIPYTEAHHLIPLGEGGADSPDNLVIVSAHIHRMLHYAKTSEIDISNIKNNQLEITLDDEPYTITWHPKHAKSVEELAPDKEEAD